MDDNSQNLMHQTNDEIRIRENAKVTQHNQDLKNSNVVNDEDHLQAHH